jgi:hypothetical protein
MRKYNFQIRSIIWQMVAKRLHTFGYTINIVIYLGRKNITM